MKFHRMGAALTAAALTVSLAAPAFALDASESEVIRTVNALGIMMGDEHGNMNLESPVTREQFVTMVMKATPGGEDIGRSAASPFPDVPSGRWSSGYVEAAARSGFVSGFMDGTFRPNNQISLAEGATIALRLLGYGPADFAGAFPTGQLAMYRSLDLDDGLAAAQKGDILTRRDSMYLFYNLMTAKNKAGVPYLTTLGHKLTPAGKIDLVALVQESMDGPVVAPARWQDAVPFDVSRARLLRNGKSVTPAQIMAQDVLYFSRSMNTVWAYSDKVTGTIQNLSPSTSAPTAVTVAGRTCPIESSAAAFDLSELGSFHLGDTVTLLLGRDGAVAAVVSPESLSQEQMGVVTQVSMASYPDGKGGTYQERTAFVMATDGQVYRYPCSDWVEKGDLVQASVSDSGTVKLSGLGSRSVSGTFSADGTKLGKYKLASDAEILDTCDGAGVRVYPGRLAGMSLSDSNAAYFRLNHAGEIDRLVLKDATGELWQPGILTDFDERSMGGPMNSFYSYTLDLGGTPAVIPQSTTRFPVSEGPVVLMGSPQNPDHMKSLTSAGTGTVSAQQFVSRGKTFPVADSVLVYTVDHGDYTLSTLARTEGMTLTGYYDRLPEQGGRIRVILAEK